MTQPGEIAPVDDPLFTGKFPVRTEIEVLPADPPGQKPVGFVCEFVEGGEVYLYDEATDTRTTIPSSQDLVVGTPVLVPGLFGYVQMKVTGVDKAESDSNVAILFRSRDDRKCWVSDTMINKKVLGRVLPNYMQVGLALPSLGSHRGSWANRVRFLGLLPLKRRNKAVDHLKYRA